MIRVEFWTGSLRGMRSFLRDVFHSFPEVWETQDELVCNYECGFQAKVEETSPHDRAPSVFIHGSLRRGAAVVLLEATPDYFTGMTTTPADDLGLCPLVEFKFVIRKPNSMHEVAAARTRLKRRLLRSMPSLAETIAGTDEGRELLGRPLPETAGSAAVAAGDRP